MKLTVCAAFVALAASPGVAPAAAAEDPAAVWVTPGSVRPGGEVELRVTGCEDAHGVARSSAFVAEARLAPAPDGGLAGETRVSSTARLGEQAIEVACDGEEAKFTGRLAVAGRGGGTGGAGGSSGAGEPDRPSRLGESTKSGYPVEATPPERGGSGGSGRSGEPDRHGGRADRPDASGLPTQPTAPVRAGGGGTAAGPAAAGAGLTIGPAGLALLSGALVSAMMLAIRRRGR
jgi:hypothetical protein